MGDFEFIIVLLLMFFAVVFILPVIVLVQISSLKSEIRFLTKRINDILMSFGSKQTTPEVQQKENMAGFSQPVVQHDMNTPQTDEVQYMPPNMRPTNVYPEIRQATVKRPYSEISAEKEEDIPVYPMPTEEAPAFSDIREPDNIYSQPAVYEPPHSSPLTKDTHEKNFFEKILGANWLSKIGIVTLVLGIGFFVKYAIDQDWINEVGRVGIGLLTGGLIIAVAHKLKAKYHVFSSILVGGGISVFYITITIAFREYELFGQTLAFALLIATTVFSVLLSLLYDRKELAIFSLLGGFASPLMVSTGTGNYIVLFSYILILNTGMLVVSYIKKWRVIGVISYILTLLFFWTWTLGSYKNQFLNVSLFVTLFFAQFYLLALFDHFKSGKKISAYQVFLILTNNLSAFLACLYVFDHYSSDIRGLITISLAVINAVIMVTLFRNSRIDRNLVYLIIAIVLSFVSLSIPIQLKGHVITLFWAAESVILLWLWQKSRIKVFYVGFVIISLLILFSYIMDINNLYSNSHTLAILSNRLFVTGVVVITAFVINMLLLKREPAEASGNVFRPVRIFKIAVMILAYVVPFLELNIQLAEYTDHDYYGTSSFRYLTLATFTTVYVAVLGIIYHKNVSSKKYIFGLLSFSVCLYAVFYTIMATDLRYDIFKLSDEIYPVSYFSVHLLSLPAIAYIVYLLIRNIKSLPEKQSVWFSWLLTVLVVVILSVETDNLVIWLSGNYQNYDTILYDVHTFGYPILWGVIAMILMIWGLNRKEALLRKISLVFFGLIIIKFYAYDVWKMSQTGRIISFVLLGVILLLVSFLQQKIRTLVKDDEKPNEQLTIDN